MHVHAQNTHPHTPLCVNLQNPQFTPFLLFIKHGRSIQGTPKIQSELGWQPPQQWRKGMTETQPPGLGNS